MIKINCPDCEKPMVTQPSISPGKRLLFCYNKISRKGPDNKPIEVNCGYRGIIDETTEKITSLVVRLERKHK